MSATGDSSEALLVVRDLCVSYREHRSYTDAVRDVSFDVAPGEMFALVGESGSGKSSVLSSLCGLLPSDARVSASTLQLDGVELTQLDRLGWTKVRGCRVAMVPQQPMSALVPTVAVGRQLNWYLGVDAVSAYARELCELGLDDVVARPGDLPDGFSGGQLQRLVIAIATFSHQPSLLLADEPTASLDRESQQGVLRLLREQCTRLGRAAMVVSHDLSVVAEHCDRVGVMHRGELVEVAAVDELFDSPKHPDARALVEAATVPSAGRPHLRALPNVDVPPLVTIDRVTHTYAEGLDVAALDEVSLQLVAGESLAIVGPSGSGKSTLAKVLVGLLAPVAGSVTLAGHVAEFPRRPAERQLVRYVSQDPRAALNRNRTVRHALDQAQRACGMAGDRSSRTARSSDVLRRVGLGPHHLARRPADLSGGELARVALARALLGDPKVLVLDEPTASLDGRARAEILDLLGDLRSTSELALLVITHDEVTAMTLGDRVIALEAGRLVAPSVDASCERRAQGS